MNADGFLVAFLVEKIDADEIAAFEHLRGRLGEAAFVAVERRHGENAGQRRQPCQQADDDIGANSLRQLGHESLQWSRDCETPRVMC